MLADRVPFAERERRCWMPKNNRSAKTGRFVTAVYAKKHPSTTVREDRSRKRTKHYPKSCHKNVLAMRERTPVRTERGTASTELRNIPVSREELPRNRVPMRGKARKRSWQHLQKGQNDVKQEQTRI